MTSKPRKVKQGEKLRGADKVARIPVKVIPTVEMPRKPDWIRIKPMPDLTTGKSRCMRNLRKVP